MTNSLITRLTGLLLVAGLFYSCAGTEPNVDELIAANNYQQAISEIDARLSEDPSQPSLYIQRGEINAMLAQETDPELRTEFYNNTTDDFGKAIEYNASDSQIAEIDSLRQQYWKDEHNAGLRISENEDLDERFHRATIHFQNALILRDDAISSYKNLAVSQFNTGQLDEAISTLRTALNVSDEPPQELLENLGYLYLEKGDPEQAAYYYELANKDIEENPNLAFGLINAYIANDNREKAVDLLQPLVENNPDNANLRNVYGTQLYEITSGIMYDLKQAYANSDTMLVEQIRVEAEGMGEQAEEQLVEAFRRDTSNTEYLESLAVFYNNLSAQYLDIIPEAFPNHKQPLHEKAFTLVEFAVEYYEKLVEADPNNQDYNNKLNVLNTLQQRETASAD